MTETNHDAPMLRMGPDPEEEALHWIVRMTSGEASEAEKASFEQWRANPDHDALYRELEQIWAGIGDAFQRPDNVVKFTPRPRRYENWGRRAAAIAAAVAGIAGLGYQYQHVWQYDQVTQGAARGSSELSDGSRVELNTGSALNLDYSGQARRVTLARGEAFFDVKHDPSRPFIIQAGDGSVTVLGTAFSVRREGKGARVTVIRGKVRVANEGKFVDVTPNQQVTFGDGAPGAISVVDASTQLAWSNGRLIFQNRPLGEVISDIARYYPGMIFLRNDKAAKRRVNAIVDLNHIDDWLGALSRSQGVKTRYVMGVVVIS